MNGHIPSLHRPPGFLGQERSQDTLLGHESPLRQSPQGLYSYPWSTECQVQAGPWCQLLLDTEAAPLAIPSASLQPLVCAGRPSRSISILQAKQLRALEQKATCQGGSEEPLTPFSWTECLAGTVLNGFTASGRALSRGKTSPRGSNSHALHLTLIRLGAHVQRSEPSLPRSRA